FRNRNGYTPRPARAPGLCQACVFLGQATEFTGARSVMFSKLMRKPSRRIGCLVVVVVFECWPAAAEDWKPAQSPLMTRWARDVDPVRPHPEYPRPTLVRADWQNLNGLWDYAIRPKAETRPDKFDGKILVPFPVESALSGVMKSVGPDNRL